jgi:hypothetical protein
MAGTAAAACPWARTGQHADVSTGEKEPNEPEPRCAVVLWTHVTPLFLFPDIIAAGGFRCGKDLDAAGNPRRSSSREDDNKQVPALDDRAPAEFVMLFRNRTSSLLTQKLNGTRKSGATWRAYPHIRFDVSAERCLSAVGGQVFGSADNVGRTVKEGRQPAIKPYISPSSMVAAGVEEILLDAARLPDRVLPLSVIECVVAFSDADMKLVKEHLERVSVRLKSCAEPKPHYIDGQSKDRGAAFLAKTRLYYEAVWAEELAQRESLRRELQLACFD